MRKGPFLIEKKKEGRKRSPAVENVQKGKKRRLGSGGGGHVPFRGGKKRREGKDTHLAGDVVFDPFMGSGKKKFDCTANWGKRAV